MKKIFLAFIILGCSIASHAQTCEERESKLLEAVGSFSATTLYNTYATIGGIADGFGHDVYDAVTVSNLLDAQKALMDNLAKVTQALIDQKTLQSQSDIDYASSVVSILRSLKTQAQLVEDYANYRKQQKLDEYETLRKKNYAAISKLMGIEDK